MKSVINKGGFLILKAGLMAPPEMDFAESQDQAEKLAREMAERGSDNVRVYILEVTALATLEPPVVAKR